ncbi:Rne/Rng family ribonuclease [Marivivens aquimaris]|uniref:Rne/Rng family ribonuclease n=1 Tax=Marivivens aquimaris TaxID=2774876 RepID=UPI001881168B|nr:ribonuclease E/G [Marivivens aquimaris]
MAKKMLIDATHAEETRVVVVDGNKVEEFDFESQSKRQLAGNIYLAKVTRVEPSLQAAFVDYGGNRHGFLAFSEIHPDYYQIPVADREALLAEERAYAESLAAENDKDDDEDEKPRKVNRSRRGRGRSKAKAAESNNNDPVATKEISGMETIDLDEGEDGEGEAKSDNDDDAVSPMETVAETPVDTPSNDEDEQPDTAEAETAETEESSDDEDDNDDDKDDSIESVADEDDSEDVRPVRKPRPKRYKIQEVVKVRQIMLVQVVKEERGNKGAALTTYLSLAGRYCVLMPNTARGGGISRKITNAADRKKLKEIANEMDVPDGAGLIIRTAGSQRTKAEIKRDYEYLQRLWEQIRELTLESAAPAKIYEEGDLIKRTIRDLYSKEIDEVIVAGDEGYRTAKTFMRMIMPSHAKNVKPYADQLPLFARYQVEGYLAGMFNPVVQLPSGGYIVIGITEALVAIDVNSGRATKEGSIEQTAVKTNLEAAEEITRQLRLRDLAGLIVIDFIDMDERKNNTAVEKRLKDKLKTDRARIQVGRISGFGLLEMSRQRLRPGMLEATTQPCSHCHGTGLLRSDDSVSLAILRQLEEEGVRGRSKEVLVKAPIAIANFLMNQKREHIAAIEMRYGMAVRIECDPSMISPDFEIEKFKTATRIVPEAQPVISTSSVSMAELDEELDDIVEETEDDEAEVEAKAPAAEEEEQKPKKRRRRRRRRRGGNNNDENSDQSDDNSDDSEGSDDSEKKVEETAAAAELTEVVEAKAEEAAAEAPAEEAVAEEKPKKRTRRSRKKVEPAAEGEEKPAEAAVATEAPAEAPAEEAAAEEKPKKRVRRSRKKVEEPVAEVAAEAPAEAPAAEAVAEEAPAQPETPEAQPAPEVVDVAAQEPEEVVTTAAEVTEAAEQAEKPKAEEAAAEEAKAEEPAAEPVAEAAPEEPKEPELVAAEEPAAPPKPKRTGWWSR